jgi:hypothetical protein
MLTTSAWFGGGAFLVAGGIISTGLEGRSNPVLWPSTDLSHHKIVMAAIKSKKLIGSKSSSMMFQ